jgi:hypothetical protein
LFSFGIYEGGGGEVVRQFASGSADVIEAIAFRQRWLPVACDRFPNLLRASRSVVMPIKERFPELISSAIALTGVFFLAASVLEWPFLQIQAPGAFVLIGVSVAFILGGGYFFLKAWRGNLEPGGKTITEVRIRAIENMQSAELVSRIARDDPDPEVRQKALQRLTEITA